ncbi:MULTISPECIES: hypothetical protein [Vibrio]|uniref:hypothetical protein n=1 Tax=Vibrio TaxID=662 RepID=UPI0001B945C8|nr:MULTISPECIES: hypothetical protein [Vibrio]EEX33514.1 conserved hypothetical protein [Vibrio coralliilyticus ATCC BAA-450]MCM5511697.1 hypothetical protein [Vibrio sp. SCSIO 43169]MDE3895988.1 hypothetical protein [Vibrio sp. CC007]QFT36142.1 hypothetical protein FIU99_06840 [Vibrio sp. THAF64]QGM34042.1 hypothetical protein GGC04_06850 [Vibrio sp. THAF191d]
MQKKVMFADFANTDLVEFKYNIDPWEPLNSSIELTTHDRAGGFRKFKFMNVSNLTIEEGFDGYLGGMAIVDISCRQWSHAQIEVQNFESGPGIRFLAMSLESSTAEEFDT